MHQMSKHAETNPELEWEPWGDTTNLHLGMKCLDLLIEATGLFHYIMRCTRKNKRESYIEATPELQDLIQDRSAFFEVMQPLYLPTIIPPKPWVNPFSGGYHLASMRKIPLVKTKSAPYLEELANRVSEMPMAYKAINLAQGTAWKINPQVLETMQQVWESGVVVKGMPPREEIPLPPKPEDIAENKEARKTWKRAASAIHQKRAQHTSKRIQMSKILGVAEKYAKEAKMYFPMQYDFRGRMYCIPSFLTPQGCDAAKGLLLFAEGKPLGESGLRWLKIHGANTYGEDKVSMDNRVKWVEENHEQILRVASDPMGETPFWTGADKPWQFLAFCFDYAGVVTHGAGYCSNLPVSVDGACNGLQHFSAMLRDPIGGAAVNLIPSALPQDIYQRVADVVHKKVREDEAQGKDWSREWLQYGFDRKATKRSVMVMPYGGTMYSSRAFVEEYIAERGDALPWDEKKSFQAAVYLSKHIWSGIGEVVVAARAAMEWLQQMAQLACAEGIPIHWRTPVGFPVMQAYKDMQSTRIRTQISGSMILCSLSSEHPTKLDRKKQCSGISPNFVHSMDACCLMLSVIRAHEEGVTNFALVHDSYGTLAADMDTLAVCLREAFVDMYQEDVLEEFQKSVGAGLAEKLQKKMPPLPEKGGLNIEAVKESVYFFA
jgi:DNA-directed RNA polymerase